MQFKIRNPSRSIRWIVSIDNCRSSGFEGRQLPDCKQQPMSDELRKRIVKVGAESNRILDHTLNLQNLTKFPLPASRGILRCHCLVDRTEQPLKISTCAGTTTTSGSLNSRSAPCFFIHLHSIIAIISVLVSRTDCARKHVLTFHYLRKRNPLVWSF